MSKTDYWRTHIAAQRREGGSVAAYCRRQGVAYASFMYWQRRLAVSATAMVPVAVQAAAPASAGLSVELSAGDLILRLRGLTVPDVAALARALAC